MDEPSVLDYLKSRLMPWKYPRLTIPDHLTPPEQPEAIELKGTAAGERRGVELDLDLDLDMETPADQAGQAVSIRSPILLPWRSLTAIVLALIAQGSLAPAPGRTGLPGGILLALSIFFLVWAAWREEWVLAPIPQNPATEERPVASVAFLLAAAVSALLAFYLFGNLQFKFLNTSLLLLSVFFGVLALASTPVVLRSRKNRFNLKQFLFEQDAGLKFPWHLAGMLAAVLLVIFFRYYQLRSVPPEMNSDHAEKILDVLNILKGQTGIFFPSNGGREALQFYLVAGLHKYLHIPLGFDILKLVTITVGFLALPFIYMIGKEIANNRVGWLAFTFAGIAYWPNVVSRAGMRLPFYMLFTAATLYFLIRGINRSSRNDFILAGIMLGLSLYGYSANRILPLCVLVAICLYLIHRQSSGQRSKTVISTMALVFLSFLIFLPLLRYMLAEPEGFFFRTLTRMSNLERPLEGSPGMIFLGNLWNALKMFSRSGGVVWPISIPDRPALGIVTGAMFYLGAALVLVRYIRQRNWVDLFLLISIPILMLPSILSLAFPAENPNLYRTGGVVVPAFLMIGLALDGIMTSIQERSHLTSANLIAWGFAALLVGLSAVQEYDLVFNQYAQQYKLSAWNSSEMGEVASDFIGLTSSPENIWVVGYPHWVDTRLVALNAGFPGRDFQIFSEQFETTRQNPGPKLFMLNPQDSPSLAKLTQMYPSGWSQVFNSDVDTKDFILFLVPPETPQLP